MSKNSDVERDALMRALHAKMSFQNRQALISILGDPDDWDKGWVSYDKPDFYRVFDDKVVGLEHFAANKDVILKDDEYQQFTAALPDEIKKIVHCWSDKLDCCDMREPAGEAVGLVSDTITMQNVIGDKNMIPGLSAGLKKHINRCCNSSHCVRDKCYWGRIGALAGGKPVQVGCLIEFSGDFRDIILFRSSQIIQNKSGLLPLSHILLWLFSDALNRGFDFIIFYRKCDKMLCGDILSESTMVMTQSVFTCNVGRRFHGEFIYGRIPISYARQQDASTECRVRTNDVAGTIDMVHSVHVGGNGIDLRAYWNMALLTLDTWGRGGFCYCDLELAATIYALHVLHAKWHMCEYLDVAADECVLGVEPYGFNIKSFELQRKLFILKYRLPGVYPMTFLRDRSLMGEPTDTSSDEWLVVDRRKNRTHGAGRGKNKKRN